MNIYTKLKEDVQCLFFYIYRNMPKRKRCDVSKTQKRRLMQDDMLKNELLKKMYSETQDSDADSVSNSNSLNNDENGLNSMNGHFSAENSFENAENQSLRSKTLSVFSDLDTNNSSSGSFVIEKDFVNDIPEADLDAEMTEDEDIDMPEHAKRKKDKQFMLSIARWATLYKISHVAISALLLILRCYSDVTFPKDSRTLLKTPKQTLILDICGGEYYHFGLGSAIEKIINLQKNQNKESININLQVNIDGAPVNKSSTQSIWPIQISDSITKSVFLVGIFYGRDKPNDCNEFLSMFVNEAKNYINEGYKYNNLKYNIAIEGYIFDTPAKSFILNVKGHTGYDSCLACNIVGSRVDNVTCFPNEAEMKPRNEKKFLDCKYKKLQHGPTILSQIPGAQLIKQCPRDYMHLICLGVTRALLKAWLKGKNKIKNHLIKSIMDRLEECRMYQPEDFSRRIRSLKDLKFWKATELRTFLLYTGPVILKNILPENMYNNFIHLHVAMHILLNPINSFKNNFVNYAEKVLHKFVDKCHEIYTKRFISHNLHNVRHIANDARNFGCLDNFSAFKFENNLRLIKNNFKKHHQYLQQLIRRYFEKSNFHTSEINNHKVASHHFHNEIFPSNGSNKNMKCYTIYENTTCKIKCDDDKNNCILLKNGTMLRCISFYTKNQKNYVSGKQLIKIGDLYSTPLPSSYLNIHYVKETKDIKSFELKFEKKLFVMKCANDIVALPLLHT